MGIPREERSSNQPKGGTRTNREKKAPGATRHQRESNKSFQGGKGGKGEVPESGNGGQVREEDG